jgi:hypothetical protein
MTQRKWIRLDIATARAAKEAALQAFQRLSGEAYLIMSDNPPAEATPGTSSLLRSVVVAAGDQVQAYAALFQAINPYGYPAKVAEDNEHLRRDYGEWEVKFSQRAR